MNPIMPCPYCGKDYDFHEDEVKGVADGSSVCLQCGMDTAQAAWITDVIEGEAEMPPPLEEEGEEA